MDVRVSLTIDQNTKSGVCTLRFHYSKDGTVLAARTRRIKGPLGEPLPGAIAAEILEECAYQVKMWGRQGVLFAAEV